MYSNYKKNSTVKYLIACNPLGAITFLSQGYGGRATDKYIVKNSGFIHPNIHSPYDQVLADRGFDLKDEFAAGCSTESLIPSFTKNKKQLSAKEIETTRKIAHVRIHIERVIGQMKSRFHILDGPLPITFIKGLKDHNSGEVPSIDKLVTGCGALVNLHNGIIYSE